MLRAALLLFATALLALPTTGATRTWTGAGASTNWSDTGNWTGGVPAEGDSLVFHANAGKETACNNLTFSYASIRIETPITLTCNSTAINSAQAITIAASGAIRLGWLVLRASNARVEATQASGPVLDIHLGKLALSSGTNVFVVPGGSLAFEGTVSAPAGSTLRIEAHAARVTIPGIGTTFPANLDIDANLSITSAAQFGDALGRTILRGATELSVTPPAPGALVQIDEAIELVGPATAPLPLPAPTLAVMGETIALNGAVTVTGEASLAARSGTRLLLVNDLRGPGKLIFASGDFDLATGTDVPIQVGWGGVATLRIFGTTRDRPLAILGIAPSGTVGVSSDPQWVKSLSCAGTLDIVAGRTLNVLQGGGVGGCRIPVGFFTGYVFPQSGEEIFLRALGSPLLGNPGYPFEGAYFGALGGSPVRFTWHGGAGNDAALVTAAEIHAPSTQITTAPGQRFDVPVDLLDYQASNPLAGYPVTFSVVATGAATASLSATSAISSATGRAVVQALANGASGTYEIVARFGKAEKRILVVQGSASAPLTLYSNRVTVTTAAGTQTLSVEASACVLANLHATRPQDVNYDAIGARKTMRANFHGDFITFDTQGNCGHPMRVRLQTPNPLPSDAKFWSFGYPPNSPYILAWNPIPARISGNVMEFELDDGGDGDFPRLADGSVHLKLGAAGSVASYQDMWWAGPEETGWGMSIVQHREQMFGVIYAYDPAGNPTWFVVPDFKWLGDLPWLQGDTYSPRGSPFYAYDTGKFNVGAPIGFTQFQFPDAEHPLAVFSGFGPGADLQRQLFGPVSSASVPSVGDMWWGGPSQNGWGIAIIQQYAKLFSVWFTYNAQGLPIWYVMPDGTWTAPDTFEGRIYRTFGPTGWKGGRFTYDSAQMHTVDVGSFKFRFAGDSATMTYDVEGHSGTLPLVRQGF